MNDEQDRTRLRPATRVATAGRRKEWTQGIVNPPVWRASTILFDDVAHLRASTRRPNDGLYYGRRGTPTIWSLADALTELEPGAEGTMLYPSGVAAIAGVLLAVLEPGDELLMVDSAYEPSRAFCDNVLKKIGVTTTYYDPAIGAGIAGLCTDRTKAIFLESPGSLTFEVQDVPAIVEVAKAHGIATIIDNTWATPLLLPAIGMGVDISILACTKYIVGHSDVMMGSATANAAWFDRIRRTAHSLGQCVSPDDAYLAARGLRTLAVRLRQHEESALKIARWFEARPEVARVLHPALPSCPGHDLWKRDFRGASGLFSVVMQGGDDKARSALIDGLALFGIGYSWGGYESLALPVDPSPVRSATKWQAEGPAIRFHIGLEDPDDLIADLEAGLARYAAAL
ncbi:cystathionine beta-lyase [Sphingomonas montanisoli]|uniref:Cystathionine beta-lyase n=1 Tax=Sphingomonas montanisoli TaxID=2606412 RepID=A0A5D9C4H7_9SPHN|nr:cystathionine beta-lyase [Sphingomonas montanisoli]TZG26112.1 cystathionine beta-lyase [Sphingomonas montanisoli]